MRVSGNGRKPVMDSSNRKTSSKSLEDVIAKGQSNISRGTSSTEKDNGYKNNSDNLEKEKTKVENEEIKIETENINTEEEKKNSEIEKKDLKTKKSKDRKPKEKKSKKKNLVVKPIGKLTGKRIAGMVLVGLTGSTFLGGVTYGIYYNCIRYPWQMKEDITTSGLGGIERWLSAINTYSNEDIRGQTGEDSYLAKELEYANGNEKKIEFIKKMISTVNYVPNQVIAKNIYGNTMINRKNDRIVYTDSLVNGEDEKVTIKYINYDKVPLDEEKIKEIVSNNKLTLGLGDYSNGLVDAFCEYMISLDEEDIPLASANHLPSMVIDGGKYYMTGEEDVFLDKALFSSEEFYGLLERFSEVAAKGMVNPDWTAWSKLSDADKEGKTEPVKILEELPTTSAWSEWNAKSDEEKKTLEEPDKYEASRVMSTSWCGAYYLLNEYESVDSSGNVVNKQVEAEVGDGTIENPASLNTGVVTSMFVSTTDSNGNITRVAKPIKVKLIDYKVSQDALNYFETKDIRNRGYDIKSEVQYASYTFEVTNLSDDTLTIYDNSSLSDELANLAPRTGTVYGLQSSVTLAPYETGVIESWGCSTELNTKYLIWGGDFNRELPVVWFRELAGDIDDPSEDKGVTINNKEETEEVEETENNNIDNSGTVDESTNVE